jgi:hypothetical protein
LRTQILKWMLGSFSAARDLGVRRTPINDCHRQVWRW